MKSQSLSVVRGSGRASLRPLVGWIGALAAAVSIGLTVGPAQAVHNEGFELDRDVENDTGNTDIDWVDLFTVTGTDPTVTTPKTGVNLPAPFLVASFQKDWVLPEESGYATGTKDTLPISAASGDWQCKTPNNLGDKFDLLNAYAAAASPATGSSAGDLIVYFGSEVSAPEGNRNMGLWLLKDQNVACQGSGNTDFSGSHTDGDVFIVSAFTGGGSTANIDVYEWNDTSPGDNDADSGGKLEKKAGFTGVTCPPPGTPLGGTPADAACAIANSDGDKDTDELEFELNTPWDALDKDGGNIGEAQFLEGAVNLTDLGLGGCFATFLANSRSSQETTSTLHDFARGSFNTCSTLNGLKYKDMDGDGARDADIDPNTPNDQPEPGLGGFKFKLMQGSTQIGSTTTSASDGTFSFPSVPAGTYTVVEDLANSPSGWVQTEPANSGSRTVVVGGAGGSVTIGDFGNAPLTDLRVEVDPQTADASQGTIYCVAGTDLSATPRLDGNGSGAGTDVDGAVGQTAIWDLNGLKPGEYTCKIVITDP